MSAARWFLELGCVLAVGVGLLVLWYGGGVTSASIAAAFLTGCGLLAAAIAAQVTRKKSK